jgi:hypothetical protein
MAPPMTYRQYPTIPRMYLVIVTHKVSLCNSAAKVLLETDKSCRKQKKYRKIANISTEKRKNIVYLFKFSLQSYKKMNIRKKVSNYLQKKIDFIYLQ